GGVPLMGLVRAAAGAIGAAMLLLPPAVRRPVIVGLGTAFVIGLFQDLVQLMLQSGVRAGLRSLLFTGEGLAPRGAVILMVLAAGGNIFWTRYRSPVRRWADRLAPPRRRALRGITLVALAGAILTLPWVTGLFISQVLVLVGLYTLMGLGLNLEVGFAGLLDLGFVAFFAIGAYTAGLLTTIGPLAVAPLPCVPVAPLAPVVSVLAGGEDEDVAEALGSNKVNVKLLAYGIGGAFAGISGAIFAVMLGSVFPHSFNVLISINVLALIIVGGMGSLPGVMVGSLALIG